jgi:hypothetical protein
MIPVHRGPRSSFRYYRALDSAGFIQGNLAERNPVLRNPQRARCSRIASSILSMTPAGIVPMRSPNR